MPILIAAKGERVLRLTAKHADAWNTAWFGLPNERFAQRHADLLAACEAEGRDPATLEVTVGLTLDAKGRRRAPERPTRCRPMSTTWPAPSTRGGTSASGTSRWTCDRSRSGRSTSCSRAREKHLDGVPA